jgi:hypothetical protein
MAEAIYLGKNGDRVTGTYDGYGRLGRLGRLDEMYDSEGAFALYHQACWSAMGRPEYTAASASADDQGHFVDEYDPPAPQSAADCAQLAAVAQVKRAAKHAEALRYRAGQAAEAAVLVGVKCVCGRDSSGIFIVLRAGQLALRCAGQRDRVPCNRVVPLDAERTVRLAAVIAEHGMTPLDDDKVNADLDTFRKLRAELAQYEAYLAEAIADGSEDTNGRLGERIADVAAKLAIEAERVGKGA